MTSRRLAPVLFFVAGGLYFAAALVDFFVPTRVSHASGRPLMSASLGLVFLMVGVAGRRRLKAGDQRVSGSES